MVKINPKYVNKYKKDVLLEENSIIGNYSEGDVYYLEGIGTIYLAKQNKGIGFIISRNNIKPNFDFFRRLFKATEKREVKSNAYRLFNDYSDGFGGITIDVYNNNIVVSFYSEGVYSFKNDIIKAIISVYNPYSIYAKRHFKNDGKYIDGDDFVYGTRNDKAIEIYEYDMKYNVYLNDGAMVGIFIDQREVRNSISKNYSYGKDVLNAFSYTGAFSVSAALGNAKSTTSVDLAKRSKPKTIEAFEVNNLTPGNIIVMDVFDYFNYAKRKNISFDLVILDPPSFSRNKKKTFSVAKDFKTLVRSAYDITSKSGIIVCSTNNASFTMQKFKNQLAEGLRGVNFSMIDEYSLPSDFNAEGKADYLKVVFIQI